MIARLPPLPLGDSVSRLPLSEPSAAALLAVLLDHAQRPAGAHRSDEKAAGTCAPATDSAVAAAARQLAEAMTLDPALALFALCCSPPQNADGAEPCVADLASRFAAALPAILNTLLSVAGEPPTPVQEQTQSTAPAAKELASAAATAVAAAETAASATGRVTSAAPRKTAQAIDYLASPAYLAELLRDARWWVAAGGLPAAAAATVELPPPIARPTTQRATNGREATTAKPPRGKQRGARTARTSSRASAAGARWRGPAGFASANFAALAVQLARLAELDVHFAARLEEEKLEALAEFAAGAGHEINNPIAVISGRAQLFLRHEHDPERRRELAVINTQARRVHEMIADLMLFARPPQPRRTACDVPGIVAAVAAELTPRAAESKIEIVTSCAADLPPLAADATQLKVALRAVCDNAFDAIDAEGRVEIVVEARAPGEQHVNGAAGSPLGASQVAVIVRDNGRGMSADERRHAFDPYYSGRGAGRGLGLGLSKCWRIVTGHGGRVELASTTAGTTITILLPVATMSEAPT